MLNNPLNYQDPSGNVPIDAGWDIGQLMISIVSFAKKPSWKSGGSILIDAVFALAPFIPNIRVVGKIDTTKKAIQWLEKTKVGRLLVSGVKSAIKKGAHYKTKLQEFAKEVLNLVKKKVCGIAKKALSFVEDQVNKFLKLLDKESKPSKPNSSKSVGSTTPSTGSGGKNTNPKKFENIPDLSKKAVKHPMNDHMPIKYARQIKYLSEDAVKKYLSQKTFFNPNWTEKQVREALNYGYKSAISSGINNGKYVFKYLGEKVTIYIENGVFKTGYGNHKLTYKELEKLAK